MPDNADLYPGERDRFRKGLRRRGFTRLDGPGERWQGPVDVEWADRITGERKAARHRIVVEIGEGFPFQKPTVLPLGGGVEGVRHRAPGSAGALCLYSERARGWDPAFGADDLLERTRTWLSHAYLDDWPAEDRPPDLHLYFSQTERPQKLVVTGEGWDFADGSTAGRFRLWKSGGALVATAPSYGVRTPGGRPPAPLASALGVGHETEIGLWFRLSDEPAPRGTLDSMLAEIDAKAGKEPGWSYGRCPATMVATLSSGKPFSRATWTWA